MSTDLSALFANWAHDNLPEALLSDAAIYDIVAGAWAAGWDAHSDWTSERLRYS